MQRTLARAVSLLVVAAFVVGLIQSGQAAMAASVVLQAAPHSARFGEECARHLAQHGAPQLHAHAPVSTMDTDFDHEVGTPHDDTHHYPTHPCCIAAASMVLPAAATMRLPGLTGGPRVVGDVTERLEAHAPEEPNEPPRTVDVR